MGTETEAQDDIALEIISYHIEVADGIEGVRTANLLAEKWNRITGSKYRAKTLAFSFRACRCNW